MAQLSKQQLEAVNQANFPNNNTGFITPEKLRDFNTDIVDSMVDENSYNIDSASFNDKIAAAEASQSIAIQGNGAPLGFANTLNFSGSFTLGVAGDVATIQVDVPSTASLVTTASFNAFTQSQQSFNTSATASIVALQNFSSSLDATFATDAQLNASASTLQANIDTKLSTSSFNSYTSSNDSRVSSLEAKTGSYATTGSNTFTGNQTFNGSLNVTGDITASKLVVQIETSSIIYSSGSNQFGDAADDVQTLYGSVRVMNQLTASGLNYPTTDGIYAGQTLQTNAAGTLAFDDVETIYEDIQNGELTTLTKGTAVYISGSQGDRPIVYRADVASPSKMPVAFIVAENILTGGQGRGITLGLLRGYNTSLPVGTQVFVDGNGTLTDVRPTGSADVIQPIGVITKTGSGGILNILNPGTVILPNIQQGYLWVGGTNSVPTAVATSSFLIDTGSFATTGSNSFVGTQRITGSLIVSSSTATDNDLTVDGRIFVTTDKSANEPRVVVQGNFTGTAAATASLFQSRLVINSGSSTSTLSTIVTQNSLGNADAGLAGAYLKSLSITSNPSVGGGPTFSTQIEPSIVGSQSGSVQTAVHMTFPWSGGTNKIQSKRNFVITGSIEATSTLTASLQEGYAWVGGAGNMSVAVATSSFAGTSIDTSSFATTGSNTFYGDQTVNGFVSASEFQSNKIAFDSVLFVSGGSQIQLQNVSDVGFGPEGQDLIRGEINVESIFDGLPALVGGNISLVGGAVGLARLTDANYQATVQVAPDEILLTPESSSATTLSAAFIRMNQNEGTVEIGSVNDNSLPSVMILDRNMDLQLPGNLIVTGSVTASSAVFTGSLTLTGSSYGNVETLSIVNQTASLDMRAANFWTGSASGTFHIDVTNIQPGQTAIVRLTTTGVPTASFSSNVLQTSGSSYVPSTTAGSIDVLTLAALDSTNVLVVSSKKFV